MPYLAHFGLEEHPFTLTPDVEYFFPTEEHANIIASVEFALRRDTGIIKVVGEVGTGKTLLCRLLIKKLIDTEAVAYINAPRASANSILLGVCHEFGIEGVDNPDTAYTALNRFLIEEHGKGRMAVVVVDEAQHLGREGLELVRLISNLETEKRKLLQIVLFGQTELDDLLRDPSMRQLNQRIAFSLGTKPLDAGESKAYINHRIRVSRRPGVEYDVFGGRAVELLARSCGGIPRVINIVADKSLLAAFADGAAVVQPKHVAEAIKESGALVKPVMQNQWKSGWLARRAASYVAAVIALAALAFAISAIFPSSDVGHRLRSMWQAAGGLPTTGTHAPSPSPIPDQTATPSPTPAPAAAAAVAPPSSTTEASTAPATNVPALEPPPMAKEAPQAAIPAPAQTEIKSEPIGTPTATPIQPAAPQPAVAATSSPPSSSSAQQTTSQSTNAAVPAIDQTPPKPKHKVHVVRKKPHPPAESAKAQTATTAQPGASAEPTTRTGTTPATSSTSAGAAPPQPRPDEPSAAPAASSGLSNH